MLTLQEIIQCLEIGKFTPEEWEQVAAIIRRRAPPQGLSTASRANPKVAVAVRPMPVDEQKKLVTSLGSKCEELLRTAVCYYNGQYCQVIYAGPTRKGWGALLQPYSGPRTWAAVENCRPSPMKWDEVVRQYEDDPPDADDEPFRWDHK